MNFVVRHEFRRGKDDKWRWFIVQLSEDGSKTAVGSYVWFDTQEECRDWAAQFITDAAAQGIRVD